MSAHTFVSPAAGPAMPGAMPSARHRHKSVTELSRNSNNPCARMGHVRCQAPSQNCDRGAP